jgi:hypothetical protein
MGRRFVQYQQRVLESDPIAYWLLAEKSGTVAYDLVSGRVAGAQNGVHTAVTLGADGIGDGYTSASYDGANSFTNIYSATLAAAFNAGEGTLAGWVKISGVGVWTDGIERRLAVLRADGDNRIMITKYSVNNTVRFLYRAGGTSELIDQAGYTTVDWLHLGITWSASAGATGEVKAYGNGSQVGATQVGLSAWVGALDSASTTVGSTDSVPNNVWSGTIAHPALWDRPLPADEMQRVYRARWA